MASKRKVLVVHRHEKGQGSSILGVFPATPAGHVRASAAEWKERAKTNFVACDEVEITETEEG